MAMMEEDPKKVYKGGSQFQDVSRYLSQNAPQANRLASQVGNQIVQAGNQARESGRQAQNQFQQDLSTSRIPYNQQLASRVSTDPRSFYSYQQPQMPAPTSNGKGKNNKGGMQFPSVLNRPMANNNLQFPSVLNDSVPMQQPDPINQADIDAVTRMLSGSYEGPTDLTGYEDYSSALEKGKIAEDMAKNSTSGIGMSDLLGNLSGGRSVAGGVLDSALLNTGGAQDILKSSGEQNEGIIDALIASNKDAETQAKDVAASNLETRNSFLNAATGEGSWYDQLGNTLDDRISGLRGGKRRNATREDVANLDDRQRMEALNRLLGSNYNFGEM